MDTQRPLTPVHKPVVYDAAKRRLWLFGQRCHHGATGALLAGVALGGLLSARVDPRSAVGLVASGSLLMAHDWHDRYIWFERGHQHQP
jgi:hypothetical protein